MRRLLVPLAVMALAACTGPPADDPSPSPTLPSPPPTTDPDAELERIMELRLDWGLQSDREWVIQVEEDPNAVISELGILVTRDEQAELQRQFEQDPRSRLIAYGARNHDTFAGLWMEGGTVVMCFTADLGRHQAATAALAAQMRVDIRHCAHTEAALKAVMQSVIDDQARLRDEGYEFNSVGIDTVNNIVRLDAKSNRPDAKSLIEARYGGLLVADIHPIPGPWQNNQGGAGWRLLAAGISRSEAYTVRVATGEADWQQLWRQLDAVNPAPVVDMASEIVASFSHGIGSSCPELRLDDVVIDHGAGLIYSVTSDPLAPRACTADLAGGAYFVVALAREAVPKSPFTVALARDRFCESCDQERITVELP